MDLRRGEQPLEDCVASRRDGLRPVHRSPEDPTPVSGCYVTNACLEARGLVQPEDCYELCLLRKSRNEYVAKLCEGEAVPAGYHAKAPRFVKAIEARGTSGKCTWISSSATCCAVALITVRKWDEAYAVCCAMCREVENQYLKGARARSVMEKGELAKDARDDRPDRVATRLVSHGTALGLKAPCPRGNAPTFEAENPASGGCEPEEQPTKFKTGSGVS